MTERRWTVNGLGDHSEVFDEQQQSWVKASKQVVTPSGLVKVTGRNNSGEKVTIRMCEGETWLVR